MTTPIRRLAVLAAVIAIAIAPVRPAAAGTPDGDAPYAAAEAFALELLGCVRRGGWVREDGTCKEPRHERRAVRPLVAHRGVADRVARPYALRLARANACTHSLNGRDVDERYLDAGFRDDRRGENLGCAWSRTPREMVLFTFRLMQNERSWNGPHWRQMRDTRWKSVGIGVMMVGTQSRVVYDFYGPAPA